MKQYRFDEMAFDDVYAYEVRSFQDEQRVRTAASKYNQTQSLAVLTARRMGNWVYVTCHRWVDRASHPEATKRFTLQPSNVNSYRETY